MISGMIAELFSKLRFLFRRRKTSELDEELAFHLEQATSANIAAGLSPGEARRQARIDFGGMEAAREAMHQARPGAFLETLLQDIRYALRGFGRNPVLVLTVVFTLALGIGANATIFSMVSHFVLTPAPVGDPATLFDLNETYDHGRCCSALSFPLYRDVRDHTKSFSGVAAYFEFLPASIGSGDNSERVWGQAATTNFFDVAQVPIKLGRGFLAQEDQSDVVVLGGRLWKRDFAADPHIVGHTIQLAGRRFTVVGVASDEFRGIDPILSMEFWVPLGTLDHIRTAVSGRREARDYNWLAVIARLRPGRSRAQASAELAALTTDIEKAYPLTDKGVGQRLDAAGALPPGTQRPVDLFLAILSVIVFLVLAIACTNVTNLMLARAASRQREMAVRVALGATRIRLLRQMLVESLILALLGGFLSVIFAWWATHSLSAFHLPVSVPLGLKVGIDDRVVACILGLSTASGLFFGFIPGWLVSRPVMARALRGEELLVRPGRRISLRSLLITAQIAMSLVLLCAMGLFLRSLHHASETSTGFRSHGLLMAAVDPVTSGYSTQQTLDFLDHLRERVHTLPGVQSVAVTDWLPLSGAGRRLKFAIEGQAKSVKEGVPTDEYMATPGYFDTMGIPLLAGHDFSRSATGTTQAVVNEAFAQRLFGRQSPIGRHVTAEDGGTFEIIGVAGNTKSFTIGEETHLILYRSLAQTIPREPSVSALNGYSLLIRSDTNSAVIFNSVRDIVRQLDPSIAVYDTYNIEAHLRDALFLPRLASALFTVFGLLGLTLASVGLYGVMSYSVSRQTREIGIRMALGAERGAVRRLILRRGLSVTLIAVMIGWPTAWTIAKFAGSFLYGIPARDPVTFCVVPIVLFCIALLACWIPAGNAASVDPQIALRHE